MERCWAQSDTCLNHMIHDKLELQGSAIIMAFLNDMAELVYQDLMNYNHVYWLEDFQLFAYAGEWEKFEGKLHDLGHPLECLNPHQAMFGLVEAERRRTGSMKHYNDYQLMLLDEDEKVKKDNLFKSYFKKNNTPPVPPPKPKKRVDTFEEVDELMEQLKEKMHTQV